MGYLGRFQFSNSYLNRVSAMDCPKHLGLCYNIVVSAIIADRNPERLIILVTSKSDYQWIVSSEILTEYKDVLNRKKLKVPEQKKQRWLRMFTLLTTSVDVEIEKTLNF